jgi:hypothetical protein
MLVTWDTWAPLNPISRINEGNIFTGKLMVLENLKNLYRKIDGFRNSLPENVIIIGLLGKIFTGKAPENAWENLLGMNWGFHMFERDLTMGLHHGISLLELGSHHGI